jgi:UTP-glucose-1-phosphate uridylyltransferase
MKKVIIGIKIPSTFEHVKQIQEIFQMYGNLIKTRLGIHDVEEENVSPYGIVLLETIGNLDEISTFEAKLKQLPTVQVQRMEFDI